MKKRCLALLISGFGSGYSPKAPGTVGSLVACLVWHLTNLTAPSELTPWVLMIVTTSLGWLATSLYLRESQTYTATPTGKIDPQEIVIDEWAGMFVSLLAVPSSDLFQILIAFLLFRFFDVTKLGPIKRAEKLPGSSGIMLDDLLAGGCVVLLLTSWRVLF